MSSKGQTFMPDFLASLLVFAVIISIFLYSWNTVLSNQDKFSEEDSMRTEAYYTTTFLVTTSGHPEDWTNETVRIPGFASSENVVEAAKLEEFRDISYDRQRDLLQAGNFRLVFEDRENEVLELDGEPLEFGEEPDGASTVVPMTRNVLVNRSTGVEEAEMRYLVWR